MHPSLESASKYFAAIAQDGEDCELGDAPLVMTVDVAKKMQSFSPKYVLTSDDYRLRISFQPTPPKVQDW